MSLYGRTDSAANVTKAGRGIAASSQAKTIVFVDNQEAALAENKARGINAPGWWSYFTYTDGEGNVRHKAEMLVTIAGPDTNANETQSDDAIAADYGITIDNNPQDASVTAPAGASFAVAAVSRPAGGSLTFLWQQSADGTTWANLTESAQNTGVGTPTLLLADSSGLDGYQYRVIINVDGGASVTSEAATLTVA